MRWLGGECSEQGWTGQTRADLRGGLTGQGLGTGDWRSLWQGKVGCVWQEQTEREVNEGKMGRQQFWIFVT